MQISPNGKNRKYNAVITGVGMYVPEKVLDNKYFETIVDTNDEWILSRTGISERRVLENGGTSVMATKAVEDLLNERAHDGFSLLSSRADRRGREPGEPRGRRGLILRRARDEAKYRLPAG